MRETGKISLVTFFAFLGFLAGYTSAAHSQDFTLEASLSENQVFVGEQFALTIEVKGSSLRSIDLPVMPQIDGIRILNATPSRGQSVSIVNGQTTMVTSYTYTLIGQDTGTFRIPPILISIDGEEQLTSALQVEVLPQRSLQRDPGQRLPDIFAEIELNDESPIVGQQLIASLVIYFKTGIEVTSYQPASGWRTDGFWKEQLENIEQPQAETVIMGDVRYRKATLLRFALFPSRSGDLTLSPFELNLGIRSRPQRNDPFGSVFGGLGTNQRRVTLETEEILLPIRRIEAPETGESIGAVGDFNITRRASVTQAYIGESIDVTTTISGEGNLPLISKPSYTFPENFEIYSPQEETDISRRGTTISGTRTFRDRVVPRTAGIFSIPEKLIAVFNPDNHRYNYITLPAIEIEVIRDPAATVADAGQNVNLQLMTGLAVWQQSGRQNILNSNWIWIGFLIPLIALAIAWRQKKHVIRLQTDESFARAHHAWDRVEELLLKAESNVAEDNSKEVYNLLHKVITGYITDRTGLPEAGMSDSEIIDVTSKRVKNDNLIQDLKKILNKCANISYAPVESTEDIETDINRTRTLLKQLRAAL
jgi:hypothetical protein